MDEFREQAGEKRVGRDHAHVNPRHDGHLDGILVVLGNLVPLEQVSDVFPVGNDQSLEAEFVPQDLGEDVMVAVDGDAIGLSAVDHDCGCASVNGRSERREEDLAQLALGNPGRCAVLAAQWPAVSHVVFQASCNG